MTDERAVTWANDADRIKDERHRRIVELKSRARMILRGFFWRTLHFTRLARPYSVAMCRMGLYRKFPDGRCMWCGHVH